MVNSIAAARTRGPSGAVGLVDRPRTADGRLLGVALLADSSAPSTHEHAAGKRLVTASLSIQWDLASVERPPAAGQIHRVLGAWPFLQSEGSITAASGSVIASSHATFVGFVTASPAPRPMGDGTGASEPAPDLDVVAEAMVCEIRDGSTAGAGSEFRSRIGNGPQLRNRFGPMHGAVAYSILAFAALAANGDRASTGGILDSRVRFLQPITADDLQIQASIVRRSRRLVDVACSIRSPEGDELLATGEFLLARTT